MIEAPARSAIVDACVARARAVLSAAVARANARRAAAFDPLCGVYVTEREVESILAAPPSAPVQAPEGVARISEFARLSGDARVHDALALLVAAEHVPRFDRVIGFLNDDLSRRAITAALLVDVLDVDPAMFAPDALLVRLAVIDVGVHETRLGAPVRLDTGFLATLRGERRCDARIRPLVTFAAAPEGAPRAALPATPLVLWGASSETLAAAARRMCADAGRAALRIDVDDAAPEAVAPAAREALVRDAVLIVAAGEPERARAVAHGVADLPVPILIEAPGGVVRYDGNARRVAADVASDTGAAAIGYPLPYGRRVLPRRTMNDVILPAAQMRGLASIVERMTLRGRVTGEWGVDAGSSSGGIRALFAGSPGTGKTVAAEAVAHALGRDLYVVDVSMVVSKYIGDTEKALATIFAQAARARVCLFFDEADAFFGKRTETKDAHDRYANIETAYLLQALDLYPDVAILATNMPANIDDALLRRIDVKVAFPMPQAAAREQLWRRALGRAPAGGVDFAELAARLTISGGAIQSAALSAAYTAAAEAREITTLDLFRAARDELAKSGRIAGRRELGDHYDALRANA